MIVICPGHYPAKPGACNARHGVCEHSMALPIVDELCTRLDAVEVTGTLEQKVRKINKIRPEFAFDLHYNAGPSTANGCEVLYYPLAGDVRREQAELLSHVIADRLGVRDRGAKAGWYRGREGVPLYFCAKTICPAFVVEPGFISNDWFVETYLLGDRSALADAIALAIEALIHGN